MGISLITDLNQINGLLDSDGDDFPDYIDYSPDNADIWSAYQDSMAIEQALHNCVYGSDNVDEECPSDVEQVLTELDSLFQGQQIDDAAKDEISGRIVKGDKIGHLLGFPTANLSLRDTQQIIPKVGVYSVTLFFDNVEHKALCNIGHRPTFFENGKLSIESYILDYDKFNLYDKKVDIKFNFYIREEKAFENKEDLIKQINKDIQVIE